MAFDLSITEQNGGNINYANDNLYFGAQVAFGPILLEQIKSDAMEIEGNVAKEDIIPYYYQYSINSVDKYLWNTEDGFFYSTASIMHCFVGSGTYTLALSIISEEQFFNGISFRFKYTITKSIKVESFFTKMILKHMPMWQYETNQETLDLVNASATFFDKVYTDIKGLYNLVDIEKVDPKYFEYLATTLGHDPSYAKKVGGNINDNTFEQYDIFQRIKNGIATTSEIRQFRQFLLMSVDIFQTGGTPAQVRKFLSLFSIDAKSIDLWTQYWGIQAKGSINERFVGYDNFEDNALKLKWQDILVIGNNNDVGHLTKEFNSFIIDNYHKVQKIEYPNDVVSEDADYSYFRIPYNAPIFRDIRKEDGNLIVSEDITSDYYDIVANTDVDSQTVYPWLLKIKTEYLQDGDRISINYEVTDDVIYDSLVANTVDTVKNLELEVKFKYLSIPQAYEDNNTKNQDNEIFLVCRGIKNDKDAYENFNEYYRVGLNAKRSVVSLAKVVKNATTGELVTQNISLNQSDTTNPIFEKLILDDNDEVVKFKYNTAYDIKIIFNGNTASAYYKESIEYNEIVRKIESNEGEVPFGETLSSWIALFENVSLDVKELFVYSTDNTGEAISSYPYSVISNGGNYGIGVRNSSIEIVEATLNNLDMEDSLYNDDEKEINLKPKYLEWQNNKLLSCNSYLENNSSFSKVLSDTFDSSVKQYPLDPKTVDAFKFIYFDNAPLSEEIASRYTVTFDRTWIQDNFANEAEVMDKIIVPFGSQSSNFMVESRTYDVDFYKNYFGETSTTHNFGTSTSPNLIHSPSFFSYTTSTTLGSYKTEPLDAFSSVTRIDVRTQTNELSGSSFQANDKISQYKLSNNAIRMRGLFEEVCPNSALFSDTQLCGDVTYEGETYSNPLFLPIVVNNNSNFRVVGVRFKHCSSITDIITRIKNGREENIEVQMYGLFVVQLPIEAVKYRPDITKNLEVFSSDEDTVIVKLFVPLGILNSEIQNYSLGTEFLHSVENSGATSITLDSVYVKVPREIMIYKEQENIFELPTLNPYEDDTKGLKCKYFLSADLVLSTTLSDYERVAYGIAYKYMMHYDFRKMLDGMKKSGVPFDSYLWWVPKELWRKRDFEVLPLDTINDIATGLNYDGSTDKYFYGNKVTSGSTLNSLRIKIKDGSITPYTTYYAKIKFRMSWSGFDELILGNASLVDGTVKPARPLTAEEAAEVITIGGKAKKYLNSMPAPVGECLDFYVPFAWYPEDEVPTNNALQWGNFLKGVNGDEGSPSVTLTPYGLMTYLILHATNSNINSEDISTITSGWTVEDWNQRFMQFVTIEYVAECIPSSKYKLYNEYGFVSKYASLNGARVDISYDAGDIQEWKVIETNSLLPKQFNSYYFNVPNQLYTLSSWYNDVTEIKASKYIVPFDLYSFSNNTLTLSGDTVFTIMDGGTLNMQLSYDMLFDDNGKRQIFTDDFANIRDIDWITYQENHIKDVYELSIRNPSETLFLGGEDPILNIINFNGINVLQNTQGTTENVYDPLLSGVSYDVKDNITITKDDNGGYTKTVAIVDEQNDVYDLEALVCFDKALNTIKGYNGKKFEFIIKADTVYNATTNTYILSSYYFVGIGTYNFDVALGVAKYNPVTNQVEKTFLAGYGDYNSNNIKANIWYKLKVNVDGDYIKILFNEENDADRMVIKYNININYQKDINKYLSGQFEELVYLVTGLDKMKITYPDNLKSIAGDAFYDNNWNESWAANNRPIGPYCGIKLFNTYTYVKQVSYKANIQDDKTFATASETEDLNAIIHEIEKNYNVSGIVDTISKTANGGIIVKYGTDLFQKLPNKFIIKRYEGVDKVFVVNNKIVIKFNATNKLMVAITDETFTKVQNVYVKDNFFNSDHIYKYMMWTDREIDEIYANPTNLYITFKDV